MARRLVSLAAVAAMTMIAGCTTLPDDPEERAEVLAVNDPLEPTNRTLFDLNMYLDDNLAEPVAETYRDTLPDWIRQAIHSFMINLEEPYVAGNDLLQGNPHAAADALGRFMINSTFGLLGFKDAVAESGGAKPHKTDIGVTLAVWGVDEGPYLMLPFLGPSNLRDGVAHVADYWAHPTGAVVASQGLNVFNDVQMGTEMVDNRAELIDPMKELKRTSLDEYAAIRSLFRQNRDAAIAASQRGQRPIHEAHAMAEGGTAAPTPAAAAEPSEAAKPASTPTAPTPVSGEGTQADPKVKPSAVEFVNPDK